MPDTNLKAKTQSYTIITRLTCRVCSSAELLPVLSMGSQSISDFVETEQATPDAPLDLVLCNPSQGGCGLLQLKHTADQNFMYRNYWYKSGVNQTMRDALADITSAAEKLVKLKSGDIVLDTGSNDNTLLKSYQTKDLQKIGYEPAENLIQYSEDTDIDVVNDYFAAGPFKKKMGDQLAKVITSIAMFYDLEDPNSFVADIKACLNSEGLWIIQMAYLPDMLKDNIFDNICHEHLEYYSLYSLEALLKRHHLKIIDVELNDVNGGSYRAYITHDDSALKPFDGAQKRLADLATREQQLQLDTPLPYQVFAESVAEIKRQVVSFINQEVANAKTVYVYGASTKGNTLLQYFGLDNKLITAAAERNPDKWGKKTVATHIPIISEKEARAAKPDYFLILPWHFLPEFKEREAEFLKNGGKFIVPLPKFEIISG